MNPWTCKRYKKIYKYDHRKGIFLHFKPGVDKKLLELFIDFAKWLRKNYDFPIRVNVYLYSCEKIKLLDGSWAYGAFRFFDTYEEPYIRIPAKPEQNRLQQYELEDVYEQILSSLAHELTHYFQWINQLQQTDCGAEWQANYYRYRILSLYERSKQIEQHS